ncbi:MAG TPA: hypothetical protein VFB75_14040 [Burkholderiales bacterium]|nr:hypothetical protein [Burkholderiales bacterium]
MPFSIQRVPQGLLNLLNIKGGKTPIELEDRVRCALEMLQMYGLQQVQRLTASGATAEGASQAIVLSTTNWTVLFGASVSFSKTATMTALWGSILLFRGGGPVGTAGLVLASGPGGPFGATETGTVQIPWIAPYPWLCPPNTSINGTPQIIGTDATCTTVISCEIGVLG